MSEKNEMIRLAIPAIDQAEIDAVTDVLRSGYLVQGPRVAEFEQAVAEKVEVQHAVAVSSGTAALHLALLSLGIGCGDIVLTTAYSWPATANVIELCGAETRFVDICLDDFNIDVAQLAEECERLQADPTTAGRLKAILPVHAFGMPANMTEINDIACRYGLYVVEDAACALGACWKGKPCGSWGIMGCFSFHPRKAITTGEGGIITTNDAELAEKLRMLRNHGLSLQTGKPEFVVPGYNYRLTEIGAALGTVQLRKLNWLIQTRREQASVYHSLFNAGGVRVPREGTHARSVYQSYVLQIPCDGGNSLLIDALRRQGIESTIGTYQVARTAAYCSKYGIKLGDFPSADFAFKYGLTLPLHHQLTADQQRFIADTVWEHAGLHGVTESQCDL